MVENLSFYKVRLVIYSLFLSYNTMRDTIGGYHGSIPWVEATYNNMGKFHVWMDNMR